MSAWNEFKKKLTEGYSFYKARARNKINADYQKALNRIKHLETSAPKPNTFNKNWSTQYAKAVLVLQRLDRLNAKIFKTQASTKWIMQGEKASKFYLSRFKAKSSANSLDQVIMDNGNASSNDEEKESTIRSFYQRLYTSERDYLPSDSNFFSDISELAPSTSLTLMYPISIKELNDTVKILPNNKSPGPDGIPYELYKNNPATLPALRAVLNAVLDSGNVLPGAADSYVVLLFKKGERSNLANWRPIALINTDTKILTRILATRLNTYLTKVLNQSQFGFTPGRSIHQNINLTTNIIYSKDTAGALFFLDQEKAYDRVNWGYLAEALRFLKIDEKFISWIGKFLGDTRISVRGSGFETEFFFLPLGVFDKGILYLHFFTTSLLTPSYYTSTKGFLVFLVVASQMSKLWPLLTIAWSPYRTSRRPALPIPFFSAMN